MQSMENDLDIEDISSLHWPSNYQQHWPHETKRSRLLRLEPSPPDTALSIIRVGLDGRFIGYEETPAPVKLRPSQSTSFSRASGDAQSFVRGKSNFVPFWPGGLDGVKEDSSADIRDEKLRTVAPGFSRGLEAHPSPYVDDLSVRLENKGALGQLNGESSSYMNDDKGNAPNTAVSELEGSMEIDSFLSDSPLPAVSSVILPTSVTGTASQKQEWAHVVDTKRSMNNFHQLVPIMARKYPFELDVFQKQAVYHLEMGDSVFVAAHTSAGKTVVAEYAIALAQKHMTKAIYTSPIKALSNQKFRDFKESFSSSSVGILTGDVQINPEGSCLIMTTEILRSMLYKGADLIRDIEFVIFDEVHYVNDAERGVVWEEVIIMLPEHISIILLSATVPNAREFADWVGRTKKKDIYVISTTKRPVPLEHNLYAGKEIVRIVGSDGRFRSEGYKEAVELLKRKQEKEREAEHSANPKYSRGTPGGSDRSRVGMNSGRGRGSNFARQPDKQLYVHLLGNLRKNALLPVVVFTFSKKKCEENAATLVNLDLCPATEKSRIHIVVEKALGRLNAADKRLPQIGRMRDLLSRGIGVHHGGLLPVIKEVVELLFSEGLVKVLFATETFAMGVNMPAKCVVFSGVRKHDGHSFRDLQPGEYTQMAGRAGRRGLDTTGTVVIAAGDALPEELTLRNIILGIPTKLQSQFRLTYNMILNLLRVEALKVEEMIKRSFSENASQKLLPEQQRKVAEHEEELSLLTKLECKVCSADIYDYYSILQELCLCNEKMISKAADYPQASKLFTAGRVVIMYGKYRTMNAAVFLWLQDVQNKVKLFSFLMLVDEEEKHRDTKTSATKLLYDWPPQAQSLMVNRCSYGIIAAPLSKVYMVTNYVLKLDFEAIGRSLISKMQEAASELDKLVRQWTAAGRIPEMNYTRIRTLEFQEYHRRREELASRLQSKVCRSCPSFMDHFTIVHGESTLKINIRMLKMTISDQNLELLPDYEQRIGVLKDLSFIDANSTVLLKGRVACEISSVDELILTELILENVFISYEPEEVVALLSCLVFQEKTDVEPQIPAKLSEGCHTILTIAEKISRTHEKHNVIAGSAVDRLKFGLIEVVYEWAKGMAFDQIMDLTDVAEGTIVRVITRLDETCREVRDAARVIGDGDLMKKMEDAQSKIKRDIVFAASLYF